MKIEKLIWTCFIYLGAVIPAQCQGSFQNLNFEAAIPVVTGGNGFPQEATAASAFPDWTVDYDGAQQSEVFYNNISTGATMVTLLSSTAGLAPIDGNYSALVQGIVPGTSASISQTGLIPPGTESLLFKSGNAVTQAPGSVEVLIGTQNVPLLALGGGPNYTLYEANIAAWASQTEDLTFLVDGGSYNNLEIDDISFSNIAVAPEPDIFTLTALGGLLFAARKWLARR